MRKIHRLLRCAIALATFLGAYGAAAAQTCKNDRRIVGGEKTTIQEHPWQVAIDVNGGLCGGSIIAQNWVLTAAHCFNVFNDPKDVRVKAGVTSYKQSLGATVERVVVHDKYNVVT